MFGSLLLILIIGLAIIVVSSFLFLWHYDRNLTIVVASLVSVTYTLVSMLSVIVYDAGILLTVIINVIAATTLSLLFVALLNGVEYAERQMQKTKLRKDADNDSATNAKLDKVKLNSHIMKVSEVFDNSNNSSSAINSTTSYDKNNLDKGDKK